MAFLLDVNLLVALLHLRHAHSRAAVRWFDEQQEQGSILVCRTVQSGALRILTHPAVMKEDVISAAEFWKGWDVFAADDRIAIPSEPEDFAKTWRQVTHAIPKGKQAETDAFLAAFAISGDWSVATFDRAFKRFRDLKLTVLT